MVNTGVSGGVRARDRCCVCLTWDLKGVAECMTVRRDMSQITNRPTSHRVQFLYLFNYNHKIE